MEEGEFKKIISGKRVKVERIALEPRVLKRLSEIDILINCREKDKKSKVCYEQEPWDRSVNLRKNDPIFCILQGIGRIFLENISGQLLLNLLPSAHQS